MQIINKFLRLRKVYIYFFSYVLFIIIFSTTISKANSFKVPDIEISSTFELNFNKNTVIDEGFKNSFSNLISMITTSGDRGKLKDISLNELKGMIDSFTISDEKFINNEYFAKLETSFNKKKVLNFLEQKNIFPSIPIKNKVLLIPILVDVNQDSAYLFTNNIFYEKWNEKNKNFHLLNYLLPSEDLEDLDQIREISETIEGHDFINLIKKYDLRDYIIIIIYKNVNEVKILSKINFNNSLKVNNQNYSNMNLNNKQDFEKILENSKIIYEDYWKKNNEINTSIKLPLTISINAKNYKKINDLENVLGDIDLISDFYILKFDSQNIQYKITYNGSPKTFFIDMDKKNFDVIMEDSVWSIK